MTPPFAGTARARREVERQLRERLAELTHAAAGGHVPDPGALGEVEHLLRLVEIHSAVRARQWRYVVLLAGGALILVLVLLLRPVRSVGVEASVRASAVQLAIADAPILKLEYPLHRLEAEGFTAVAGVPSLNPSTVSAERLAGGTLTLQQVTLPAGSQLRVERYEDGRIGVRVEGGQGAGEVNVALGGASRVILDGDTVLPTRSTALRLGFGADRFSLRLVPSDSAMELLRMRGGDSISFVELQELAQGARSNASLVSTIMSGELVVTAPSSEKVMIAAGEHLHLVPRSLRVSRLAVDADGVVVDFRARARELALGYGAERRDLRPSVLESYAADRPLHLAGTVLVSALGFLVAVLYWWNGGR